MKVTMKQLAKMLMEEKTVLATHHGGEEGTEGYEKDVLSRSWGDDEEADPKLDFVDEARWNELAGIMLSEQGTGSESDKEVEAEAQRSGAAAYDAIFDVVTDMLMGSISGLPGDDPHPAMYNALIKALQDVATDLEVEKKEVHPPEFITLWEPGYGPGSA